MRKVPPAIGLLVAGALSLVWTLAAVVVVNRGDGTLGKLVILLVLAAVAAVVAARIARWFVGRPTPAATVVATSVSIAALIVAVAVSG
jgi:hypothetical protein